MINVFDLNSDGMKNRSAVHAWTVSEFLSFCLGTSSRHLIPGVCSPNMVAHIRDLIRKSFCLERLTEISHLMRQELLLLFSGFCEIWDFLTASFKQTLPRTLTVCSLVIPHKCFCLTFQSLGILRSDAWEMTVIYGQAWLCRGDSAHTQQHLFLVGEVESLYAVCPWKGILVTPINFQF